MKAAIDWLFRNRETGAITIAQVPNLPLGLFIVCWLLRLVFEPAGTAGTVLTVVASVALAWWAIDEVVRGVNPWRRMLGGGVLVVMVVGLVAG